MGVRLLIVSRYDDAESFGDRVTARLLLAALEERNISFDLHLPWNEAPDLQSYDVVLFWTYRFHHNNYIFWARELQKRCLAIGKPIINPVDHTNAPHSFFLDTWGRNGIPCAKYQRFRHFPDIRLDYPLILRRDGFHMGRDMNLLHSPEEARELIERRQEEIRQNGRRPNQLGPFDLAIQFVDTSDDRSIFRKWRSVVVGDRIIPRHLLLSRHWLVNFGNLVTDAAADEEDRRFMDDGELEPELVLRAARLTGADIVALDYGKFPDGRYVFWEANRHFLLLGDRGYDQPDKFLAATGRDDKERLAQDRSIGLAMADLILARAAGP